MVLAGVTVDGNGLVATLSTFVLGDVVAGKQTIPINKTAEALCYAHTILKENLSGEYIQKDTALRTFRLLPRRGEEPGISYKASKEYSVSQLYSPGRRINLRRARSIQFSSMNEFTDCSCGEGRHREGGNSQPRCWADGSQHNVGYRRTLIYAIFDDDFICLNEVNTSKILYLHRSDLTPPSNYPKKLIVECFDRWVVQRMATRRQLTSGAGAGDRSPKMVKREMDMKMEDAEEEEYVQVIKLEEDSDGYMDGEEELPASQAIPSGYMDDEEELPASQPIPSIITRH